MTPWSDPRTVPPRPARTGRPTSQNGRDQRDQQAITDAARLQLPVDAVCGEPGLATRIRVALGSAHDVEHCFCDVSRPMPIPARAALAGQLLSARLCGGTGIHSGPRNRSVPVRIRPEVQAYRSLRSSADRARGYEPHGRRFESCRGGKPREVSRGEERGGPVRRRELLPSGGWCRRFESGRRGRKSTT